MQRIIRIDRQPHGDRDARPEVPAVELEILRGAARHRRRPVVVPVFLIGTAEDCDLMLGDAGLPEVHTYLYVRAEGVTIRSLGAAPALHVEGRSVESARLRDGNCFAIGPYAFRVHISGDEQPPHEEPTSRLTSSYDAASRGQTGAGESGASGPPAIAHDARLRLEREHASRSAVMGTLSATTAPLLRESA
jgi:predicted component of type VI protein secretion system